MGRSNWRHSICRHVSPLIYGGMVLLSALFLSLIGVSRGVNGAASAQAADGVVPNCWSPADLAVRHREWRARRGRGAFSMSSLHQIDLPSPLPVPPSLQGSIRGVSLPPGVKLLALTFDLCEGPFEVAGYDGRVIDYLRREKVPATLFASGKWLMSHPKRAQQLLADRLFELGGHGWAHKNFRRLSAVQMKKEIALTLKAFAHVKSSTTTTICSADDETLASPQAFPYKDMRLFRFPYGVCTPQALKAVNEAGQLAIQWSVVSGDPAPLQSARRMARVVLQRVRPGSIVVMHANGRGWNTAKALPLIVPQLRAMGYRFVTVGDLLKAGQPLTKKRCYENRPGDNRHY